MVGANLRFWAKKSSQEKCFDEFAGKLSENCHDLAEDRIQKTQIPAEKYKHMPNFAGLVVSDSYSMASIAYESGHITKDQQFQLFFEYLCFFMHLIDRSALSIIGDPARHILMDELGTFAVTVSIQTLLPDNDEVYAEELFQDCMRHLNAAQYEYSQYPKIIESGDEGQKGILLWEFSKKVAGIKGSGQNLGSIFGEEKSLVTTLNNLDINSFLEKMK